MNLADILDSSSNRYPDKVAIRYKGKAYSYAELWGRVRRLASALLNLNVTRHSQVAVISPNSNVCIEILFACAQIGAICEMYNTRLSATGITRLLEASEASLGVVATDTPGLDLSFLDNLSHPLQAVVMGEGTRPAARPCAISSYETLIEGASPLMANPVAEEEDVAVLLYTSGTTALPRGVLLSHKAILFQVMLDAMQNGFAHDDIALCVLPLYHVTFVSAVEAVFRGAELVIADSPSAPDIAQAIERFGVTRVGLVPFILKSLARYVETEGIRLSTLRLIIYGAEPINPACLARFRELFGCEFYQGYGMTETSAAITALLPEHHRTPRYLATVGKPLPGVRLRIVDDEDRDCAVSVPGEILVKTASLMQGYYHDQEYTDQVIKDRWYHTGDIGFLDDEGFLHLVDRKDNLVISAGENVYPLEVSHCIKSMSNDVLDVTVTGVPDECWGESLVALVVLKKGSELAAETIIEHCSQALGGYKKPKRVFFVEKIGRNTSGKVSKKGLRDLLASLTIKPNAQSEIEEEQRGGL
jgi:long-chain acyl-CoA synthetase